MVMEASHPGSSPKRRIGWRTRLNRIAAKPGFQRWAARFPLTRGIARREGQELFEIVQGFVKSQLLYALIELRIPHRLMDGPLTAGELAQGTGVPVPRMTQLAQAGAAMGLLTRQRSGAYGISRTGAAMLGVPGLEAMIRHHDVLYRDMADPVALLRGEVQTELADFWPYVFGAQGAVDPVVTETYSDLMAQSQGLVADDTLRMVSLGGVSHLLDIGGGFGTFVQAAARGYPRLQLTLFDLPVVTQTATERLQTGGAFDRITVMGGSFRDDPLPRGADAVSLIRVLYDHQDDTVRPLLRKVWDVLPAGGRLIISEPMSGGAAPESAGDIYFAFYCMAMRTGTVRSQTRIAELCQDAGFTDVKTPGSHRPFVTSVVTARKDKGDGNSN